jgi:dephospho-CoA kinase
MMLIGLTGSIAMGKSEAAKYLASLGFPVFDSDSAVHKLYDSEQGAALIRALAPQAIVDGKVNRPRLSELVLNDKQLLGELEKIVHAEIQKQRIAFVDEARVAGAKAAILDIPLLFETGAEKYLDKVIVVSAPADIQRARALARPGMTAERLDLILARQMPDAEKCKRADAVIDTSLALAEMQKSLLTLFTNWGLIDHA